MALPKVIHPTKKIQIPSLGRELEFEPFTTQDEKAIILLDKDASLYEKCKLQKEIIEKCCRSVGVDFSTLSTIELAYVFLQLRKISVGGALELSTTCPKCNEEIPTSIDIGLVQFEVDKLKPLTFTLNTSDGPYIVECTHIRPDDLQYINSEKINFEDMAVMLRSMSKPDGNDIIEFTHEEKLELFNQLDSTSAEKIVKYANNAPKLVYHMKIICPECNHEFEGDLQDFFI